MRRQKHDRSAIPDNFETMFDLVASTFFDYTRDNPPLGYHGYFRGAPGTERLIEDYERLEEQKEKVKKAANAFLTECEDLVNREYRFLQAETELAWADADWNKRREEILAPKGPSDDDKQ